MAAAGPGAAADLRGLDDRTEHDARTPVPGEPPGDEDGAARKLTATRELTQDGRDGEDDVTRPTRPSRGPVVSKVTRPRERAEALVGKVLGSYRLVKVIGRGGMGRVYLAEHVLLGRQVALKLLRPEYAMKRDAVARFFQEAKAVNKIRHRNIVDVTDFVALEDRTTFIIMELLEGISLGKLIRTQGQIPAARLLPILVQVCDGLEAAHQMSIVHRDLKPDNIFLCRSSDPAQIEVVKLLDFGVAKLVATEEDGDDFACQTAAGVVVGTPAYMSPEQAASLAVDGRSDIYALGAIMYELFTGQAMFAEKSFSDLVVKHLHEMPLAPRKTRGGGAMSPELEELILRCLAKAPEERYQTVGDLRGDLVRILGGAAAPLVLTDEALGIVEAELRAPSGSAPASRARSGVAEWAGSGARSGVPAGAGSAASSGVAARAGSGAGAAPSAWAAPRDSAVVANDAVAAGSSGVVEPTPALAIARSAVRGQTGLAGAPAGIAARRLQRWRLMERVAGVLAVAALAVIAYRLAAGGRADLPVSEPGAVDPTAGVGAGPLVAPMAVPDSAFAGTSPGGGTARGGPVIMTFRSDPTGARVYPVGDPGARCITPCEVTIDPADGGSAVRRVFTLRRSGHADREVIVLLDQGNRQEVTVLLEPSGHRPDGRPGIDVGPATARPATGNGAAIRVGVGSGSQDVAGTGAPAHGSEGVGTGPAVIEPGGAKHGSAPGEPGVGGKRPTPDHIDTTETLDPFEQKTP